jgi:hypothetical protein
MTDYRKGYGLHDERRIDFIAVRSSQRFRREEEKRK